MKKLYGVTTAMITPFDRQGKVDLGALKELVNFLISKEVNCLYPTGSVGEMYKLTLDERKAVAETVVETANGRVSVFVHVGAMTQNDTIHLAQHAEAIGADGIGVITPSFFKINDREMEEYFVTIAESVSDDFPIYMYNLPQCTSNDIKPGVAQKIVNRSPNVVGIKYSYPDVLRLSEYLEINNGDFSVMQGADLLFGIALHMGCSGVVSGTSCVYPEPFVALYKAFQSGNMEETRRLQKIVEKYSTVLRVGTNVSYYKEALRMRGLDFGYIRAPQLDITPEEIEELREQLNKLEKFN
jgi:4-hydroxy-tetrahydrodipicolinate synthase